MKLSSALLAQEERRRPRMVSWDEDDDLGWLDSGSYRNYSKTVLKVIERLSQKDGRPTFGEIKRALGDNFTERYPLTTVFASLAGAGDIECVSEVCPTRYRAKAAGTAKVKRSFNGSLK